MSIIYLKRLIRQYDFYVLIFQYLKTFIIFIKHDQYEIGLAFFVLFFSLLLENLRVESIDFVSYADMCNNQIINESPQQIISSYLEHIIYTSLLYTNTR